MGGGPVPRGGTTVPEDRTDTDHPAIDTFNWCFVGVRGEKVALLRPGEMTPAQALTAAAYLVTMAKIAGYRDPTLPDFADVLKAVEST